MQVTNEVTLFMQKAIYFVSKPIAARGMLELTDIHLYFQVFPFDASFGIKHIAIDVCTIKDVRIEKGDLHPRVIVVCAERTYEFVLSKGQELYERLRDLQRNPLQQRTACDATPAIVCGCGKSVNALYRYCPWCGARFPAA